MSRVVLHIDRLVLRGVAPREAAAVAEGLRDELQQRLAVAGAEAPLCAETNRHRIDAGRVRVAAGRGADALGRAVAGHLLRRTSS